MRRIKDTLGELPVVELDYRVVTEWQAKLARELAPRTVRHHRQTLAQVVDEAVKMGALVGNPVRSVKPLRVTDSEGVALDRDETRALLAAAGDHRLGAAVRRCYSCRGGGCPRCSAWHGRTSTSTAAPPSCGGRRCTSMGGASSSAAEDRRGAW